MYAEVICLTVAKNPTTQMYVWYDKHAAFVYFVNSIRKGHIHLQKEEVTDAAFIWKSAK